MKYKSESKIQLVILKHRVTKNTRNQYITDEKHFRSELHNNKMENQFTSAFMFYVPAAIYECFAVIQFLPLLPDKCKINTIKHSLKVAPTTYSSRGRKPMHLTYDLKILTFIHYLDCVGWNQPAKYLGQRSLNSNHCPDTHTHTKPVTQSGPRHGWQK